MKERPTFLIATYRPLVRFVVVVFAVMAGWAPAPAQDGLIPPDPNPLSGVRIEGPLLSARSPSQIPGPPSPSTPGPFQIDSNGPALAPLSDAAADGPEPIVSQPLLVVPPLSPPLPPLPASEPLQPNSAFGSRRSTQIQQPRGVLGNTMGDFSQWFKETLLWGDEPFEYLTLPSTLLWKPPLANQREPRFYGKFTNLNHRSYIDTAIGAQFGLGRIAPKDRPHEGIQLDIFGAVFTRFDPRRFLTAADYRAGIPLTYKKGPWSTKLSYEHTSTHVGDEFSQAYGRKQKPLVIDEVVHGVSRFFGEHIRLYGQLGYAFNTAKQTNANRRERVDLGISYSNYADTGPTGRPYAAFDMDLRGYQNYTPNVTFQVGWQWVHQLRSVRLGFELYEGRSPFGQFYTNHEQYAAFAGYYDW